MLAGTPHDFSAPEFDSAVAARFTEIQSTLVKRTGDFLYSGTRTLPECLGWRLRQNFGSCDVADVAAGAIDDQIAETWHAAASAEHWYRYEKDYGIFD